MPVNRRQQDDGGYQPTSDPSSLGDDEDKNDKNYIGVPSDYSIPGKIHGREEMGDVRFRRSTSYMGNLYPRYEEGAEYIPANFPATQIWQLQQALAKSGLLKETFTKQVWDNATRNAYKSLLALANAQGTDANTALMELLDSAQGEEGKSGKYTVDEFGNVVPAGGTQGPPPLVTRTTDPASLRRTFRKAVIEMLGEGWSQEEIDKMVAAYNNVEIQRQTQAYNMDVNETAGNLITIPSPEDFIASEVEKRDPIGVQTNEALDFTGEFMNLANSPAWGVG